MAGVHNIELPAADILYIESTLPAGITIAEYRRTRVRPPSLRRRVKALVARSTPALGIF